MKNRIVTIALPSLLAASFVFAEDNSLQTPTDRVGLFNVALQCPAAPEIGCGVHSKPILLELEREPTIAQAWLKGTGTVLVVVWGNNSNPESLTKVVQAVLEKNGLTGAGIEWRGSRT
jgi:hypothetical protein